MILTCPQCTTRYQVDGSKFPAAGRSVRCAKCGHVWHQIGPEPEPDPDAEIVAHDPSPSSVVIPEAPNAAAQLRASVFPSADTTTPIAVGPAPAARSAPWMPRFAVAGGWLLLLLLIVAVGWAAVSFRSAIAAWLPQTAPLYAALGLPVSPSGMDFSDVVYKRQTENGQPVLAVTGKIVNRGDHELAVPAIRVALYDGGRHELYHWTFVPGVATLSPGQFADFSTRLATPPGETRSIEVTFARPGE